MVLCCLDQSTKKTGYSIWENKNLLHHGVIDTSYETDTRDRMWLMYWQIKALLLLFNPEFVIIEETQFQSNQKVFRTLAQLQGLVFAATLEAGSGVMTVEPTMWKSFVGIQSKKRDEQKVETIKTVETRFNIHGLTDDEADSVAIGIWGTSHLMTKGDNDYVNNQ